MNVKHLFFFRKFLRIYLANIFLCIPRYAVVQANIIYTVDSQDHLREFFEYLFEIYLVQVQAHSVIPYFVVAFA